MKKKLMALLMTAVMALGMSATAFAVPDRYGATWDEWAAWYPTEEGKNVCAAEFDSTENNTAFPVISGNVTSNVVSDRDSKAAANVFGYGFNLNGSEMVPLNDELESLVGGFSMVDSYDNSLYKADAAPIEYYFTSLAGGAGQVTLNVKPAAYADWAEWHEGEEAHFEGTLFLVAQFNSTTYTWEYGNTLVPVDANGYLTFNSNGSSLTNLIMTDLNESDLLVYPSVGQSVSYDGKTITRSSLYTVTCTDASGNPVKDTFASDGTFTYYFQADGTAMTNRLTYHPNGINVIYFDAAGHEIFSNFHVVTKNIEGNPVDDYCFFNVYGYQYVNTVTYSKDGTELYYINPYGRMEMKGWFAFDPNAQYGDTGNLWNFTGTHIGYAYWGDGDLARDTTMEDDFGREIYLQANGEALYY